MPASQPGQWRIEQISKRHERDQFDCDAAGGDAGNQALNEFLIKYARQNAEKGLGRTYVAVREGEKRVRGYYTLASGSVAFETLPESERKKLPRYPVPVALIARLAVDKTEQGRGLGADLLMHALFTVVQVAEDLGIRAIEVKAKNDSARRFYSKYGFESLLDDPLHMYVALEVVIRAFLPPAP
jgi:GNAT superfamily N-acetyltransferase